MKNTKSRRLDLNMMRAFCILLEECNVTRAAARFGVTQSAMSATLSRLRDVFEDPLFVNTGAELRPTQRALTIEPNARRILDEVDIMIEPPELSPDKLEMEFLIFAPEHVLLHVLPNLIKRLSVIAPGVSVFSSPLKPDNFDQFSRGRGDISVLPHPLVEKIKSNVRSVTLATEDWRCIACAKHYADVDTLTLEMFTQSAHLAFNPAADQTSSRSIFAEETRQLKKVGIERHITHMIPSYLLTPFIVPGTDHIALIPKRTGELLQKLAPVRLYEPPFAIEPLKLDMIWQNEFDKEPTHIWFRECVMEAYERENEGG